MEYISENYSKELAQKEVKSDTRLTSLQKEILITIIGCEKFKGYAISDFEESDLIFNKLGTMLDKEFSKIGKKYYSYFSWWYFKKTFEKSMGLTSNLVLANWFSLMGDSEELIEVIETDSYLEEIYIIQKSFLNNMNIEEILNYNNEEGLNCIASIWLNKEETIEAISNFLQSIAQEKYLKSSSQNIMYYENGHWFKKSTIQKHKWKKRHQEFISLNSSKSNNSSAIANNN